MSKKSYCLASGFKEDCMQLLSLFEQTNSIRFENFCTIWKEMKFAFIFAGRQTYSELLEFCEEVMSIAKQFVLPPYSFKAQIGGLYLLYGLYYKMPIKDIIKIRVTQDQWISLMELQEQLKEGEHLDANFILSTLIHDEAFINTVFDFEWGLEKHYRQKQIPINAYTVMPSLLELAQEGHPLAEVDDLAKKYRQATSSFSKISKGSSLKLFNENFVQNMLSDVRRLESSRHAATTESNEGEPSISNEKKEQGRKDNRVRPRIGDGFDMDTSDEEEEVFEPLENYDPNLADNFDDFEVEHEKPNISEISLSRPIKKDLDVESFSVNEIKKHDAGEL